MARGVKSELTPAEIADRDLQWLIHKMPTILQTRCHYEIDAEVVEFLRGIAKTCNSVALFHQRRLGITREGVPGRRPKDVA